MITAPILAGVLVLILGTAGNISTTFGIVLIGLGPIIWLWNFFIRMSFIEEEQTPVPPQRRPPHQEPPPRQQAPHEPGPRHPPRKLTRPPRRRS